MTFGREADEQLSQRIIHRFPEDIYPYRFIQRFQRV
jgi:hypothetical protein